MIVVDRMAARMGIDDPSPERRLEMLKKDLGIAQTPDDRFNQALVDWARTPRPTRLLHFQQRASRMSDPSKQPANSSLPTWEEYLKLPRAPEEQKALEQAGPRFVLSYARAVGFPPPFRENSPEARPTGSPSRQ